MLSACASIQIGRIERSRPSALIVVRPLIISLTSRSRVSVDWRSPRLALFITAEERQAITMYRVQITIRTGTSGWAMMNITAKKMIVNGRSASSTAGGPESVLRIKSTSRNSDCQ